MWSPATTSGCALFARLARRVPLHRLRPDERRALSPHLFSRDTEFVDLVAYALTIVWAIR